MRKLILSLVAISALGFAVGPASAEVVIAAGHHHHEWHHHHDKTVIIKHD